MVILPIASNYIFEKTILEWKRAISHLKILNFHIYTNNKTVSAGCIHIFAIYKTAYNIIIKRGCQHKNGVIWEKLDEEQYGAVGGKKKRESDAIIFQFKHIFKSINGLNKYLIKRIKILHLIFEIFHSLVS